MTLRPPLPHYNPPGVADIDVTPDLFVSSLPIDAVATIAEKYFAHAGGEPQKIAHACLQSQV